MNPGRELDALVAEKVMGWRKRETPPGGHIWIDKDNLAYVPGELPRYSTDIAAAWEVVEKLNNLDFSIEYEREIKIWRASFEQGIPALEREAPLAICFAALNAVGVDV